MPGKVRLKIGPVEVEVDGDQDTSHEHLLKLAADALRLYKREGLGTREADSEPAEAPRRLRITGSTASIAARLNCISGPELIVAAAAWLTFVEGKEWFESSELLEEMQKASAHYDLAYKHALTDDVKGLVKSGKLVEVAEGLYALSATMRRQLQRALAE